jgi:hypothetical protein
MNSGPKKFKQKRKIYKQNYSENNQWRRNIDRRYECDRRYEYGNLKRLNDDYSTGLKTFINAVLGSNTLHTKENTVIYIHHNLIDSTEQQCSIESKEVFK